MLPSERDPASDFTFTGNRSWHIIAFVLRRGIFFFFFKQSDISCLLRKGYPILAVTAGPYKENHVAPNRAGWGSLRPDREGGSADKRERLCREQQRSE